VANQVNINARKIISVEQEGKAAQL